MLRCDVSILAERARMRTLIRHNEPHVTLIRHNVTPINHTLHINPRKTHTHVALLTRPNVPPVVVYLKRACSAPVTPSLSISPRRVRNIVVQGQSLHHVFKW